LLLLLVAAGERQDGGGDEQDTHGRAASASRTERLVEGA
jgi:hypothetical protein